MEEIYYVWTEVSDWNNDEDTVRETAHRILQHVEEFQANRVLSITDTSVYTQWRASD